MKITYTTIINLLSNYEQPKRIAISKKYPLLRKPIIFIRHLARNIQNFFNFKIKHQQKNTFFNCVVARHQSLLRRQLGVSNPKLQEQKIINLQQAIKKLNGVIIQPNDIFSLWNIIGKPKYEDGYVDGMLLTNGKITEGIGGGLCQLSNFLFWIFLHAPIEIKERHHHSMDVFPDSGRTLPFGSGATILYNFFDLQIKNRSNYPIQLKIWLTEKHLKGQLLSPKIITKKFNVLERNHFFIKRAEKYFRYNEIYRKTKSNNKEKIEKLITNFAPVLYDINDEYLQKNNFKVLDFTKYNLKPYN